MNIEQIKQWDQDYFVHIYNGRYPLCFTAGDGVKLMDVSGRQYIDFTAGIAVNCLGYNHPALVEAICAKAMGVMHCSNFYYIHEQAQLAKKLCELSFGDKVFFANSGTEANEGAVKMAKRYFTARGESRYKVITLENSFHGRTLAMVAATGQVKYQAPYQPLTQGFVNVKPGDIDALAAAVDEETCAIMLETVQGEGGIQMMDAAYLQAVRQLCDEQGILMILDEVQTGIGRTGEMFGYQHTGIQPDIMTLAKGLGGGVPIGAIVATDDAAAFQPGEHGTTFGGNPLACSAALTVLHTLEVEKLLDHVQTVGQYLHDQLHRLTTLYDIAVEVRGIGLMQGLQLSSDVPVGQVIQAMMAAGYLLCPSGGNTLRMVPPLIMDQAHIQSMIQALDNVLCDIQRTTM